MSENFNKLYSDHARSFHENRFVYPVVSRRSKGVSVGINLNPDKVCNFDCIYCQVDRRSEAETRFVEMDQLLTELEEMIRLVKSGELFEDQKFSSFGTSLSQEMVSRVHSVILMKLSRRSPGLSKSMGWIR